MQPLVLHPTSVAPAHFGHSRYHSGPERLSVDQSWALNARGYPPRASFPRRLMSGSPPAPEPNTRVEIESSAGSSLPGKSPTSIAGILGSTALPSHSLISTPTSSSTSTSSRPGPLSSSRQTFGSTDVASHHGRPVQEGSPSATFGATLSQPLSIGSPYSIGALGSPIGLPGGSPLVQKPTRRAKAHVASACVNCKKKHLGCDAARPCRRCVLAGKASTCVDVTHKKRGRPPLKAEDSSLHAMSNAQMESLTAAPEREPATTSTPARTLGHRATLSREIRPMTDLQRLSQRVQPALTPSAPASGGPQSQSQRWSASVFPLTRPLEFPRSTVRALEPRPMSSSSGPSALTTPTRPTPILASMANALRPHLQPGSTVPAPDYTFPMYSSPGFAPSASPPKYHFREGQYMPGSTESRLDHSQQPPPPPPPPPQQAGHHRGLPSIQNHYQESPVRLPPIRPTTTSPGSPAYSHHAHRLSDPYPAGWSSIMTGESPQERRSPAPIQRPVLSPFSYSSIHRRSTSMTGSSDPIPRHSSSIELPSPLGFSRSYPPAARSSATWTSVEQKKAEEGQEEDQRPLKRRRMALDEMVND
ncbi:Fungal Zn(2)-Cys(6) binuclear cluster domain-containing protein [Penicillium ucsense]|uniref:Fungal Zn(2)-Cys(6) binuclear cluster domain-containing protein n=1 Tax=Penicillium ucsense TaxID=2839758 RepID=A0A8J8W4I5_9EURO|nr:Fungal Zn(2)-Cys(6) binuclear cluster domain-containing protein [Penicillium ucsense]KAF7728870.1 Fungal Zn(2)-Cys(6) binuclear cluster domain-containing protein [Penicillium ucsense]